MHLSHSTNLLAFLKQAKNCKGVVLLRTAQGDSLDLRSELCQLIAMLTLKQHGIA